MRKLGLIGKSFVVCAATAAVFAGITAATASAARRPPAQCICTDQYAPVTCSNGVTYSNACRASCAGATGCVPGNPI